MGDVLQGYMFDLVADYCGLSEKSPRGSKAPFSGLIDGINFLLVSELLQLFTLTNKCHFHQLDFTELGIPVQGQLLTFKESLIVVRTVICCSNSNIWLLQIFPCLIHCKTLCLQGNRERYFRKEQ